MTFPDLVADLYAREDSPTGSWLEQRGIGIGLVGNTGAGNVSTIRQVAAIDIGGVRPLLPAGPQAEQGIGSCLEAVGVVHGVGLRHALDIWPDIKPSRVLIQQLGTHRVSGNAWDLVVAPVTVVVELEVTKGIGHIDLQAVGLLTG